MSGQSSTVLDDKRATPRSLGYSMPAEWTAHSATWLSWPHNLETWPTQLESVREVWIQMISLLAPHERVYVLVNDQRAENEVYARLESARAATENVRLLKIPTIDVWMRDYGPTFVTRSAPENPLAFNDWLFNGWGGKYPSYELDDRVARELALFLKVPVFKHEIVLEGGSIELNGAGTCLTTEQCLLNQNRNPQLSRAEIDGFLKDSLGVSHMIWLGDGIVGDDTDGHIDDIARFIDAKTVACIVEENSRDENYRFLQENYERLQNAVDQNGARFSVVRLPCPEPVYDRGVRLPASYANFYIANEVVLVPIFNDPRDVGALGLLQELFPNRKVHGLRCNDVVAGLGAIHCVTQQQPWTPL
ncbi:MAG TPA: agmatine deiminase family protein [Candidatus Binatia bacterium]|nr:agmatine deiminase family protein [Candidatus Binatia bacterium]